MIRESLTFTIRPAHRLTVAERSLAYYGRRVSLAVPRPVPVLRQLCSAAATPRRAPQPPMPRVLPYVSTTWSKDAATAPPVSSSSSWRSAWQSGTILLTIGWTGLALLVLDRYLQYQQFSERLDAAAMVQTMEEEIRREKFRLHQEWHDKPVLFYAVIRREYKQMGGSHGLRGAHVGDVVEILDEGVGPERAYNVCRLRGRAEEGGVAGVGEDQIGWFPVAFMEKVPPPTEKKSIWRRMFAR